MLLERPVEGGFRLISHLRACLRDADGGLNQSSRCELHAPPAEIVHGGNADIVCETIGKDRSRQADLAGKAVKCPIVRRSAMDQLQRLSNMPVASRAVAPVPSPKGERNDQGRGLNVAHRIFAAFV